MICQNCGQEFTVTPASDSKKFCPKCFIQKLNHLANRPDPVATKPMDDPMQPITDTGTGQPPVEPTTPPVDPTPVPSEPTQPGVPPSDEPTEPAAPSIEVPEPTSPGTPPPTPGEEAPAGGTTPPTQPVV